MDVFKTLGTRLLNGWQLSRLSTFEVTARHESLALATDGLALAPGAVSYQINQLEKELGVQLFVRSHCKVEPTRKRERVYQALKSSLGGPDQKILDIENQEPSDGLTIYSRPPAAQRWSVPALGDLTRHYPAILLTVLIDDNSVNLQQAGIDPAIYFDDAPSSQLSHHLLMSEAIVPVCTPSYTHQLQLTSDPASLHHCTLPHDHQAWSSDLGIGKWFSWAQQFGVELPQSSGTDFDRSDLAVIAMMNRVGVTVGHERLVQKRLESGELITPFGGTTLKYHQHYYVTTPPGHRWPKIDAFIEWLHSLAWKELSNGSVPDNRLATLHLREPTDDLSDSPDKVSAAIWGAIAVLIPVADGG